MAECGRDVVEVGHVAHVDPRLRHRHDHIGIAERQRFDHDDFGVGVGDHFADKVFTGDAEVDRALRQLLRDFGGREIGDLDAIDAFDRAAIVACTARLDEFQPGARKERFGVFLQPALGRNGDDERAHATPPTPARRSMKMPSPTAGIFSRLPRRVRRLS